MTSERVPEIGIELEEGILAEVLDLVPRVEHGLVLVRARECQLYADATIYRTPSVFAAVSSDGTVLIIEADEV